MGKETEYVGVEKFSKEFCFQEKQTLDWLFIPQKFFIDILKYHNYDIKNRKRKKATKLPGGESVSVNNPVQSSLL